MRYRPDETKNKWLARHGMGPGPADPDKIPYYLLIVGDPEAILYRFQNQLDVQYAVGRIHFDTLDEYAAYARSVVQAETSGLALPKQATFFGVRTPGDQATELSADHMIKLSSKVGAQSGWQINTLLEAQATKANLAGLINSGQTPALLYTASHGMGFPNGDPRQLPHQGVLLCQDWPGPGKWKQPIPPEFYFSADDVSSDARLLGSMAFFFACYGAGTPHWDEFAQRQQAARRNCAARFSGAVAAPPVESSQGRHKHHGAQAAADRAAGHQRPRGRPADGQAEGRRGDGRAGRAPRRDLHRARCRLSRSGEGARRGDDAAVGGDDARPEDRRSRPTTRSGTRWS